MKNQAEWQFRFAVAALVPAMMAVQFITARGETQTWDEGIHLAAGYSYLKTGDFRMNAEHPALFKLLAALPLELIQPDLPLKDQSWEAGWQIEFGNVFMHANRVHPDRILAYGRSVTILMTAVLGIVLAFWTRRHFGAPTALGALFLFATDPNVIAHGRYVTNDLMVTLFSFAVVIAWAGFLHTRRRRDLAVAGVLLGLGLLSKFSSLFLIPVLVLLYGVRWWQQGARPPQSGRGLGLRHGLVSLAVVAVIAAVAIGLAYGPATVRSLQGPALTEVMQGKTAITEALRCLGWFFDLPAHPYLLGLNRVSEFNTGGHNAYLLGQHSMFGWWYYFPVVFLVKTPTAVLLLTAVCLMLGAAALGRYIRNWRSRFPIRKMPFRWIVVTLPPALYAAVLLTSHVDLGVRYLLPIYPFLFVLLAAVVFHTRWQWFRKVRVPLLAAICALQLFETARIYPHYLAFFNTVSGGPDNGPLYLADSNIDWGQDVKKLKTYVDSTGWKGPVCVSYFGTASTHFYGVPSVYLPETKEIEKRRNLDCLAAISVTQLYEVYAPRGSFAWLREMKPIAKVGYSIYIYDLRKRRTP